MTVKRRRDDRTPRYLQHRVADIRGGVSIAASELGGDYLPEGAVLSLPDEKGICHVVKIGEVAAEVAAADKTIKVKKLHNFKVGDFITAKPGGKAEAITAIDESNKTYDILTVGAALGAITLGECVVEAKEKSDASELKYEPKALNGTGKPVDPKSNLDTDAWLFAVTKGLKLPGFIAEKLKGIINY